jgi:RNA polymerase sigma-70 factor (ECF subfamily)
MYLQLLDNDNAFEEAELWQDLIAGNRDALDTLFRSYYAPLLNYGMRLVTNRDLVKDAIQKLFLKLWDQRRSLSRPESIKSYLFVSIRRILLARLKRQRARDKRNRAYSQDMPCTSFNIEDDIIAGETQIRQKKELAQAICQLSPRQKEALYLRFYDGLRNKEIAEVMAITHQSVRNHISEAIKAIQRYLPSSSSLPHLQRLSDFNRAESI